ncbi:hypothetical protein BH09PSE5_BH09PSE5_00230 [soil metagenome]
MSEQTSKPGFPLPTVLTFSEHEPRLQDGTRSWTARGQNFSVRWIEAAAPQAFVQIDCADEAMVLLLEGTLEAAGEGATCIASGKTVCILSAGKWRLKLGDSALCAVLESLREDAAVDAVNGSTYAVRDARVRGVGAAYARVQPQFTAQAMRVEDIEASPQKPRLKMVQTSTMSINWVEYEGARDRTALSPHSHSDIEQGSLALAGEFEHHLRWEWGSNANDWQDDRHIRLGSPSLMVVPATVIHTSEGVGPGRHILIDVFSPPRGDCIATGWVFNAGDYTAPAV